MATTWDNSISLTCIPAVPICVAARAARQLGGSKKSPATAGLFSSKSVLPIAATVLATLAPGLSRELMIFREAALFGRHVVPALASGLGSALGIIREIERGARAFTPIF
jgi:hypothetical protein